MWRFFAAVVIAAAALQPWSASAMKYELRFVCDLDLAHPPADINVNAASWPALVYVGGANGDFEFYCTGTAPCTATGVPNPHGWNNQGNPGALLFASFSTTNGFLRCYDWDGVTYQEGVMMTTGFSPLNADVVTEVQRQSDLWFSVLLVVAFLIAFWIGFRFSNRKGDV